jgi:pyrroline-5-carboxylate reductase
MSTSLPRIAFIGAGNMGEAMLRGLAKAGHPKDRLCAFDLRTDRLRALAGEVGFLPAEGLGQAVSGADVLVLAVKPQGFNALMADLAPLLSERQTVISIAAGVTLGRLQGALGAGIPLVRVMPNTPGLIGQGVSAYCLGAAASARQAVLAEDLLKPLGKVLRVDETDMDAVTALSGSGPAYVFLFMEALQQAGASMGLSQEAVFLLASQTLIGAGAMIVEGKFPPADLRAFVTSPGGTTAAALKVLEDGGFRELMVRALAAARARSAELGKG